MYIPMFPMGGQHMMPHTPVGKQGFGPGSGPQTPASDDTNRKRKERVETNHKWTTLDSLVPPQLGWTPPGTPGGVVS
jgi:hypothetical protein